MKEIGVGVIGAVIDVAADGVGVDVVVGVVGAGVTGIAHTVTVVIRLVFIVDGGAVVAGITKPVSI